MILSCYREDKDRSEKERRATHTSGFVVKDEGDHKIALYLSGRRHAGENLDDVLERRSPSLPLPIKMSDAAAVNGSPGNRSRRQPHTLVSVGLSKKLTPSGKLTDMLT